MAKSWTYFGIKKLFFSTKKITCCGDVMNWYKKGEIIKIWGVKGMPEINGQTFVVKKIKGSEIFVRRLTWLSRMFRGH